MRHPGFAGAVEEEAGMIGGRPEQELAVLQRRLIQIAEGQMERCQVVVGEQPAGGDRIEQRPEQDHDARKQDRSWRER